MKEEMTRKEKREFIKLEEPESIYVLSIAWVLSGLFLLFFYLIFLKK